MSRISYNDLHKKILEKYLDNSFIIDSIYKYEIITITLLQQIFNNNSEVLIFTKFLYYALSSSPKGNFTLFLTGDNDIIKKLLKYTFQKYLAICNTKMLTEYDGKQDKEIIKIKGKKLVLCELNHNKKINSAQFNLLNGHKDISIEIKNKIHSFTTTHKLIVISKDTPTFDKNTDSVKKKCVQFKLKSIKDQNLLKLINSRKLYKKIIPVFMDIILNADITKKEISKKILPS